MKSFNELRSQIAEQGQPTGIKLYHTDKEGKESHTVVFTPRDAQQREKEVKKAGGKTTHRAVMYGKTEGEKVAVKEETDLAEIEEGVIQRSGTDKVTEGSVPAERNRPAISAKDKGTLGKIADLMAKEKAKKKEDLPFTPDKPHKPIAKAGKYGSGYSTARHLARQGMKDVQKEETSNDGWYKTGKQAKHIETGETTYEYEKYKDGKGTGERHYRNAAGKVMGEEVEQIDEVSMAGTETNMYGNTTRGLMKTKSGAELYRNLHVNKQGPRKGLLSKYATNKLKSNIKQRLTTPGTKPNIPEEVDQIDELSKGTLGSYVKKATQQAVTAGIVGTSMGAGHTPKANQPEPGSKQYALMRKREAGVHKAVDKLTKEETEMSQMDKYLAAISGNADFRTSLEEKTLTPAELKKREEIAQAIERENPGIDKSKKMAIATATAKRVAEEVELEEAISDADKETMKKRAAMARPELEKTKDVTRKFGGGEKGAKNVEQGFRSAIKRDYKKMDEEVVEEALDEESLDEISVHKMLKYSDAAQKDRAKLNAKWSAGTATHREKEKVIGREEGEERAANKIKQKTGKYPEQLNALQKARYAITKEAVEEQTTPETEKEKKLAALAEPKDKITHADVMVGRGVKKEELSSKEKMKRGMYNKEGVEMKTFSQLMAELDEAKKDDYWDFKDLKDEPKSGTRKIAGTRYGGSAQKDEPEEDDEDDNNKPAVKRGRGRPAGSKSGARH